MNIHATLMSCINILKSERAARQQLCSIQLILLQFVNTLKECFDRFSKLGNN